MSGSNLASLLFTGVLGQICVFDFMGCFGRLPQPKFTIDFKNWLVDISETATIKIRQ